MNRKGNSGSDVADAQSEPLQEIGSKRTVPRRGLDRDQDQGQENEWDVGSQVEGQNVAAGVEKGLQQGKKRHQPEPDRKSWNSRLQSSEREGVTRLRKRR